MGLPKAGVAFLTRRLCNLWLGRKSPTTASHTEGGEWWNLCASDESDCKGERNRIERERERRGGDRCAQRERVKLSQHDLTITRKPHCSSRAMPSLDHAGSFTLSLGHFTQLTPHHSSDPVHPPPRRRDRAPTARQAASSTHHAHGDRPRRC